VQLTCLHFISAGMDFFLTASSKAIMENGTCMGRKLSFPAMLFTTKVPFAAATLLLECTTSAPAAPAHHLGRGLLHAVDRKEEHGALAVNTEEIGKLDAPFKP